MNQKELFRELFDSFFVIFTISVVGLVIYMRSLGSLHALLSDIVAIFVSSILTALSGIIFYSKRELGRAELIIRYLIHSAMIFTIIFSMATYMGWIYWGEPVTVLRFAILIVVIFVSVHAVIFYQTKRLADNLNEKLNERYKK